MTLRGATTLHRRAGTDAEGRFVGLRVTTHANLGAYLSTFSTCVPTYLYGTLLQGLYTHAGDLRRRDRGVHQHRAVDALRGAGRPEATYLLERLVDTAAHELGIDPAELRSRNFIPPFDGVEQPGTQTQVALQYDSGNYQGVLDKALAMVGYDDFRREQEAARARAATSESAFPPTLRAAGSRPRRWWGRSARAPVC